MRPPTGTADSDERYLLSAGGTTVKIRDGLMDVKALLAVDADGLQQWRPVLKVAFPIDGEAVRAVWEALRLPAPALARETYTAEQLEAELTGPGTGVRAVAVHKHRVRYVIDGCTSELTDVIADGRTTRTIAVETEDPALVTAAVRTLGLADYRNTAYPPGLAALLDGVAAPVRGHRRRHELDQVPRGGAATAAGSGRWSTAPSSPAWARGWRRAAR